MSIQIDKATRVLHDNGFTHMSVESLLCLNSHFITSNKRIILVMSHTSTEDFLYGLLLFKACSDIPIKMFTSFKDPILQQLSVQMGMITSNPKVSNTQAIITSLEKEKEFALLISLAKTAANQKVHSGYFHIAKALQVPIIVIGFDYFLKTGYVSSNKWHVGTNQSYINFQHKQEGEILSEIAKIFPLKPEFQVGFDTSTYPFASSAYVKLDTLVPNTPLLFANTAKECFPAQVLAAVIVVIFLVLLLLLFLFMHFKNKQQTNKTHKK